MKTGYRIMSLINNQKGSALIAVIVMLVVIMILTASVATIFSNNLKQTVTQEQNIQAYYLALSGIELAVSALLLEPADEDEDPLLDEFKWDQTTYPDIADDLLVRSELFDTISIGDDTVAITITPINTGSKREVRIHALGTKTSSGITESVTLILEAENPLAQRWF